MVGADGGTEELICIEHRQFVTAFPSENGNKLTWVNFMAAALNCRKTT